MIAGLGCLLILLDWYSRMLDYSDFLFEQEELELEMVIAKLRRQNESR